MIDQYFIEGCSNLNECEVNGPEYNDPLTCPDFQRKIEWFKIELVYQNIEKRGFVVLRVFDGEFWFIRGVKCGNVGTRHISKDITWEAKVRSVNGCLRADVLSTQLYSSQVKIYNEIFKDRVVDLPMEIIYGLVANKWILKQFKNKICIIGGAGKIRAIKALMKYDTYRDYVENDQFEYISIPERFACDDPQTLLEYIGSEIEKCNANVFLYGIGMVKMQIAYKFKTYKPAVFVDIGCGVSALAGTVGPDRPYFGLWANHRMIGYDYSDMDQTDYQSNENTVYLKINP